MTLWKKNQGEINEKKSQQLLLSNFFNINMNMLDWKNSKKKKPLWRAIGNVNEYRRVCICKTKQKENASSSRSPTRKKKFMTEEKREVLTLTPFDLLLLLKGISCRWCRIEKKLERIFRLNLTITFHFLWENVQTKRTWLDLHVLRNLRDPVFRTNQSKPRYFLRVKFRKTKQIFCKL